MLYKLNVSTDFQSSRTCLEKEYLLPKKISCNMAWLDLSKLIASLIYWNVWLNDCLIGRMIDKGFTSLPRLWIYIDITNWKRIAMHLPSIYIIMYIVHSPLSIRNILSLHTTYTTCSFGNSELAKLMQF